MRCNPFWQRRNWHSLGQNGQFPCQSAIFHRPKPVHGTALCRFPAFVQVRLKGCQNFCFYHISFSFLPAHGRNVYLLVCHVPFLAKGVVRILHRARTHMTDQHIYFSGWPRFIHTCLGLTCLIWRYFYVQFFILFSLLTCTKFCTRQ